MKYYFLFGIYPFSCGRSEFEAKLKSNSLEDPMESIEDVRDHYQKNEEYYENCYLRVFGVEEDGDWYSLFGVLPHGSVVCDEDFERLCIDMRVMYACLSRDNQAHMDIHMLKRYRFDKPFLFRYNE